MQSPGQSLILTPFHWCRRAASAVPETPARAAGSCSCVFSASIMPCSRMVSSFSIIGSCSLSDLLIEVLSSTDVVVWRWNGWRFRRCQRFSIERVLQNRLDAPVSTCAGEQDPFPPRPPCVRANRSCQAALHRGRRGSRSGGVACRPYALDQAGRVRTDLLRPLDQPR